MSIKNKLNSFLTRFNVQVHGLGYLQSLAKGEFKKNEFDFFKQTFGNKPIVIYDVGANRGSTILEFLKHFPLSRIIAFEPVAALCDEMKKLFSLNQHIKIENFGISDSSGQLTFYINQSIDTSSFLPSKKTGLNSDPQVKNIQQLTVAVKTIEESFVQNNLTQIHILKLDIQGSELNALKGAERLLIEKKIDLIYTEAYFIQQYVDQPLFPEIAMYLLSRGYHLQDIYNPIYGKGKLAWCDAVFVRDGL
jgi:FkbM family methyltransferase